MVCQVTQESPVERIKKYGKEHIGIFPTEAEGQVTCQGVRKGTVNLSGTLRIKIRSGCRIRTKENTFGSEAEISDVSLENYQDRAISVNMTDLFNQEMIYEESMWKKEDFMEASQWAVAGLALLVGLGFGIFLCILCVRTRRKLLSSQKE
jgi:hypothetical protein